MDVGSSVPYFPSFPLSQIFLSVLWSVFRYLLENGAWKVWFCGVFFFFLFSFCNHEAPKMSVFYPNILHDVLSGWTSLIGDSFPSGV